MEKKSCTHKIEIRAYHSRKNTREYNIFFNDVWPTTVLIEDSILFWWRIWQQIKKKTPTQIYLVFFRPNLRACTQEFFVSRRNCVKKTFCASTSCVRKFLGAAQKAAKSKSIDSLRPWILSLSTTPLFGLGALISFSHAMCVSWEIDFSSFLSSRKKRGKKQIALNWLSVKASDILLRKRKEGRCEKSSFTYRQSRTKKKWYFSHLLCINFTLLLFSPSDFWSFSFVMHYFYEQFHGQTHKKREHGNK